MKKIGFSRPGLPNDVNFPLCLAPMVGLSHVAFRDCLAEYLPEGAITIWPSEMLNSRRIPHENLATTPETMKRESENYWMPQILGNEEVEISKAVTKLMQWGAQGIDINMGCPVKKALRHNYGVSLMGDADYAAQVVQYTKKNCDGPVSVKLRAGKQTDVDQLITFVQKLETAGADWLAIHPRDPEQKRRGSAYWPQIKVMRDQLKIPVIGNGDIQTCDDVFHMFEQTDCDMVMAGRVLTARPWLFWQLGEKLNWPNPSGKFGSAPMSGEDEAQELGIFLKKLCQKMFFYFNANLAIRRFQFYVRNCSPWLLYGNYFYGKITSCKSEAELIDCIDNFFSTKQFLLATTDLRN